jgi:hypothetical protein
MPKRVNLSPVVIPAHDCQNTTYADAHGACDLSPRYREVRRGPEDEAADMLSGDGWILPRADAERRGLI